MEDVEKYLQLAFKDSPYRSPPSISYSFESTPNSERAYLEIEVSAP